MGGPPSNSARRPSPRNDSRWQTMDRRNRAPQRQSRPARTTLLVVTVHSCGREGRAFACGERGPSSTAGETKRVNQVVDVRPCDIEPPRHLRDVPVALRQRPAEKLRLKLTGRQLEGSRL